MLASLYNSQSSWCDQCQLICSPLSEVDVVAGETLLVLSLAAAVTAGWQ